MLWKMLMHATVAAAIVGSAAAVYAQIKDNGYLTPAAMTDQRKGTAAETGSGSLDQTQANVRPREGERHERKRDHDDDND